MSDISFSKLTWENLPARTTALSATNLNRIEKGIADSVDGVNANSHSIAELQTRISQLANGSPTPVATIAEMTDESAVYLYTGSESGYTAGNWYYWNGSAWTSGGTYGGAVTDTTLSISGAPADAKAVGEALADKADADAVNELNGRLGGLPFSDVNTESAMTDTTKIYRYDGAIWFYDGTEWAKVGTGSGASGAVVVTEAADMTDNSLIYLYEGTETGYTAGHFYYYNGTAWVTGTITNSGKDIMFNLPLTKPLAPAVKKVQVVGMYAKVRQGNKYLWGTAAARKDVDPEEVTAYKADYGVNIVWSHKTALSGALNNDVVGIDVEARLKFTT